MPSPFRAVSFGVMLAVTNLDKSGLSSRPWDLLKLSFGSWFVCNTIFALTGPVPTLFYTAPVLENWFLEDDLFVILGAIIKKGSSFALSTYLYFARSSNFTKLASIYLIVCCFLSSFYTFALSRFITTFYYFEITAPGSSFFRMNPYALY